MATDQAPLEWQAADEAAMEALGARLAAAVTSAASAGALVFLHGELGAGKTTFTRGLLRALGHRGAVKSPTYTLVEPYRFDGLGVYHFDLYRLGDPEELEFLGMRDYLAEAALCLVEWPEKGAGWLPKPDLDVTIKVVSQERRLSIDAPTAKGEALRRILAR